MRRLVTLALVMVAAILVWSHRHQIGAAWHELRGSAHVGQVPSPELADSAQAKLANLSGSRPVRVALSEAEVQSLIRFRVASYLPAYVVEPDVSLTGDRLQLRALVPAERFPRMEELAEVMGFLPDTTAIAVTGQLIPLEGARVGLAVDEMSAARIPLPRGLIPTVLRRFGRTDVPGLPPDAVELPLPAGAATAYIRADSLIFVPRSRKDR